MVKRATVTIDFPHILEQVKPVAILLIDYTRKGVFLKRAAKRVFVKILNDFLSKFDSHQKVVLKADKVRRAKTIIKKYSIPERYLAGLSPDEKFLRQIELVSKKRMTKVQRYKTPLVTDAIARKKGIPKKGSCTKKWESMHPLATTNVRKSQITGIPKNILDKVENKGVGAFYSSGSRPGQTGNSWGKARVNCFILNKPTVTSGPDKHLYLEALKSPRAKRWFAKTKWL